MPAVIAAGPSLSCPVCRPKLYGHCAEPHRSAIFIHDPKAYPPKGRGVADNLDRLSHGANTGVDAAEKRALRQHQVRAEVSIEF